MSGKRALCAAAVMAAVLCAATVQAADYTWNAGSGGTFNWEDNVNWLPNTGYPNGAGVSVLAAPSLATTWEVNVPTLTLGGLDFSTGGGADRIGGPGGGTAGTLVFDNGASNATVTRGNVSTTNGAIMAFTTYQLNSSLNYNVTSHITSMLNMQGKFSGPGALNIT